MVGIAELPGLGEVSAERLARIGIDSRAALERVGPIEAFVALERASERPPSLNLLYAMVGALEGRHWSAVAREERLSLLLALEARQSSLEGTSGVSLDAAPGVPTGGAAATPARSGRSRR